MVQTSNNSKIQGVNDTLALISCFKKKLKSNDNSNSSNNNNYSNYNKGNDDNGITNIIFFYSVKKHFGNDRAIDIESSLVPPSRHLLVPSQQWKR